MGLVDIEWTSRPAIDWPAAPYPGERPDCSWRLVDGWVHRLTPAGDGGWFDATTGDVIGLAGRVFLLAYGSNANPAKLHDRGVDAVMLAATITGAQAVWCNARRSIDRSVVATLVESPGQIEQCPVLALRAEQLPTVDSWEIPAYHRRRFWGRCALETGADIAAQVYVGGEHRPALLDDTGAYVPLHHSGYAVVDALVPVRE